MGTKETSSSGNESLLEIKLMSAKDLWSFNFFQKLTLYAVASLTVDPNEKKKQLSKDQIQEQRTPTDPDGDGHPEWNHPVTFDLSPFPLYPSDSDNLPGRTHLLLRFELRHQIGIPLLPDKLVGEVSVPLSDLLDGSVSPNVSRFVDYQIKSPDGKPNGVLRFSYQVPGDLATDNNSTYYPGDLNFGISGYSDQNQPNSPKNPPGLYPPLQSVNEDINQTMWHSQSSPNSSYHSGSAPAVYPPTEAEEDYLASSPSHYPPPPPSPMCAPQSDGFWSPLRPPPPPPHHLHYPPPPPPPFFHHPPPPPGPPAHWGRPPGSQQQYYEHGRGY